MNHTDLAATAAARAAQTIERTERDLPYVRSALLANLDEVRSLIESAKKALETADTEQAEELAQDAQDALTELTY
jgi:hypothetical protein